uniref:branched-chain amino acid ABC transporter permease n=1 Tax=Azospirillum canadense TaxID=403962 RepID=UPI002226D592|nr:branched-chain amino acid ABC transporter permease [Azospirillum canadense]
MAAAQQGHATGGEALVKARTPVARRALLLAALVAGLLAPFAVYPLFLMKVLCFALFASAFNLLLGYGGLLSFGHAAYFGGASYVTAYCVKLLGFDPVLGIVAGVLGAGALGTVCGYLAIRRQGIYFSMITLALAQMVYFLAVQAPFTNNDEGIQGVPRGTLFGLVNLNDPLAMYYFVFACFAIGSLVVYRAINSPFGNVLRSIRENEARATSLGYFTERYKLLAFVLSTMIAGLAGSLDALVFQLASLTNVHWTMSGHAVLMTILGGVGTISGPLVGAFIVAGMENYLAHLGSWVTVIHGGIFIVCVMVFRRGIVGETAQLVLAWSKASRPPVDVGRFRRRFQ